MKRGQVATYNRLSEQFFDYPAECLVRDGFHPLQIFLVHGPDGDHRPPSTPVRAAGYLGAN